MNFLWGNFDFEHHLGPSGPRTLPASVQQINAELAFSLAAIAEAGDFIWSPELPDPGYARYLASIGLPTVNFVSDPARVPTETTLVPWGWTEGLRRLAARSGWRCEAPDPAAVAKANSREFSSSLEREWSVGLPDARTIRNLKEFHDAVESCARHNSAWVVKANFGMSARERILGRGAPAAVQAVQWVQKQLAENEAVYFEPWVDRIEEIGLQFTVPKNGEPVLEGITPLLTDHLGTYRGSRFRGASCQLAVPDEFAQVIQTATQAARRIQQLGYFGPLGIDAMHYRTADGETRWRPLQDINARLTMGRLALGLRRIVPESQHASWLHQRRSEKKAGFNEATGGDIEPTSPGTRVIRTSPSTVGGQPSSRISFLCTAPTAEALHAVERFWEGGRMKDEG